MSHQQAEISAAEAAFQHTLQRASEIRIYGHSTIFYWWPVWVVGYVMAIITYMEGSRAVIVPAGSVYEDASHAIVLPAGSAHPGSGGSGIGGRSAGSKEFRGGVSGHLDSEEQTS